MSASSSADPTPESTPKSSGHLYVAIIVYACDVDAPGHETLYEECYTVIRASSTDDAIARAEAHARRPLPRYKG